MVVAKYLIKSHSMNLSVIITSIISIVIACLGYIYIQKRHPIHNEPNAPFVIICFFFYIAISTNYLTIILLSLFVNMTSILRIVDQVIPAATTCLAIAINLYLMSVSKKQDLSDIKLEIHDDTLHFTMAYGYLSAQLPNIKSYQPPKKLK